ncbi:transmembrane channel-like protein 7 [Denticeps clupeoides]|uniref:Transmembrane channel-like protein n=1 Tax=Denticeps clupeoides TaxID=299321 RepID=A0AAY4EG95_9TELE|nr:transmembrane channel-like protein 8 [Denticeps clupeoides]
MPARDGKSGCFLQQKLEMAQNEERRVQFFRLLSDESYSSDLTDDSYEYYQTEIYEQLPSTQTQNQAVLSDGQVGQRADPNVPLRALPLCIQKKRSTRELRQQQRLNIAYWESWSQSQKIFRRRLREQIAISLSGLLPWRHTLIKIEGLFGMGVKGYFTFLRYLLFLNLFHSMIIGGTIVIPSLMYRTKTISSYGLFFLDIFHRNESLIYFRFYERGSLDKSCLNTPLLFLLGIISLLIISFGMVVHRMVVGYKNTRLMGKRFNTNMSNKVFSGWDFCIQDHSAADLKHNLIRNELKMDMEEQGFHLKVSQRTVKHWACLTLLRVLVNIAVLCLLGGSFYLIYYVTTYSKPQKDHWMMDMFFNYLPPITITMANYLLPRAFCKFAAFEDYSLTTQLNLTLIRSVFLKLTSLGIYIFSLYAQHTPGSNKITDTCWEDNFGKKMLHLSVFDLLACIVNTFFVSLPLKWLVESCKESTLAKNVGKTEFMITQHVLDLVYGQTASWVGVFFSPLLPAINAVKLILIFYMKKFTVLHCCAPPSKVFRTYSSSVMFHFMLLLGLIMAVLHLSISLTSLLPGNCGPFKAKNMSSVMNDCVKSLPDLVQTSVSFVASDAFALILIMAEIVILTFFVSRGQANRKAIERLKDMLVMCSADKRFLVMQHTNKMRLQHRKWGEHLSATSGASVDSHLTHRRDLCD